MTDVNTQAVVIVNAIDRDIYHNIKAMFHNAMLIYGLSVNDLIAVYQQYGQHQINFEKIYDLGE